MKKIPTLFQRSEDRRHITTAVLPGYEPILAGVAIPTRKWDGTCVKFDGDHWFCRREVKPGSAPPIGWVEVDHDETTGKHVGWEMAASSGFYKFLAEAIDGAGWAPGTYELCGPKINGNPEGLPRHTLLRHGSSRLLGIEGPQTYQSLFQYLNSRPMEGIVWWLDDAPVAKLKRKDFPR